MYCIPFKSETTARQLARDVTFSLEDAPHPLCLLAATELQEYLEGQQEWQHNFGLTAGAEDSRVIGKMFGVLAVRKPDDSLAYLAAFSGKLAGSNQHARFVPPVFDTLAEGGFVNAGMRQLTAINDQLHAEVLAGNATETARLKTLRKDHSTHLQQQIFAQYQFVNKTGRRQSLTALFKAAGYQQPPAGAGECAAPKLLQYAFLHGLTPLALTEFWWGLSPKSATWKHRHFYAPCKEKCAPILAFMLGTEA